MKQILVVVALKIFAAEMLLRNYAAVDIYKSHS